MRGERVRGVKVMGEGCEGEKVRGSEGCEG